MKLKKSTLSMRATLSFNQMKGTLKKLDGVGVVFNYFHAHSNQLFDLF